MDVRKHLFNLGMVLFTLVCLLLSIYLVWVYIRNSRRMEFVENRLNSEVPVEVVFDLCHEGLLTHTIHSCDQLSMIKIYHKDIEDILIESLGYNATVEQVNNHLDEYIHPSCDSNAPEFRDSAFFRCFYRIGSLPLSIDFDKNSRHVLRYIIEG